MVTESVSPLLNFFDTFAGRNVLTTAVTTIVAVLVVDGGLDILGKLLDNHVGQSISPSMHSNAEAFIQGEPFDENLLREMQIRLTVGDQWIAPIESRAFWVLSLIYTVVASLRVYFRSRSIAAPLENLAEKSTRIAQGKLGEPMAIDPSAPAEARRLVTNFNRLTLQLNALEEDLQFSMSSIAHELRTPLTVVRGYLMGAKDGVIELNAETVERALSSIEGLERIVFDLDTLSTLERTALSYKFNTIDVCKLVQNVVNEFQMSGMKVTASGNAEPVFIDGDIDRLRQILSNVLENARRYSGADKPVLVETLLTDLNVQVTVADNGPGFDSEAINNAMRAFWRGDSSRVGDNGAGLGLAIARALARGHGGDLILGNNSSGGARISLILPR